MLERLLALIHLLGVVTFFANAIAALFWQVRASRSRDVAVVAYAFQTLQAGDRWLTPGAVVAITVSGVALALVQGRSLLGTGWIAWSIVAFTASGAVFLGAVLPRQRALARWTSDCHAGGEALDWPRYQAAVRRWAARAHGSLALALLALVLMMLRPQLPALRR